MVTTSTELLGCRELLVGYGRPLLPPVSLSIGAGETWAVVGRNGSGKTTLFRTLLGLVKPLGGTLDRHDTPVAYVAQRRNFDPLFPVSVFEVVSMGLFRRLGLRGEVKDRVMAAMEEVRVADLRARSFRSLSEGQKQRVLLARMVVSDARLAFLDEPTAAMDAVAEQEAMDLLLRLQQRHGMAVVVVSHHMAVARRFADRACFLDPDGEQVLVGEVGRVFDDPAFVQRYGSVV